ncbi:MAG TPA: error-prone DNA polymerase, partial [Methylomirabilota bacterium]|nr:error-prone DNA polymerase [Methylomirabilota bacterium]
MSYVELHARTAFSFLRGGSRPEELAAIAASQELPAVAVCDRDGVYGAPLFTESAKEKGLRPMVGAEITLEDETVLPVLVKNRQGYQNLCQLLTQAHLRAEKGRPRVRWDELPEFAEGLVALTGDEEGPLVRAVLEKRSPYNGADPASLSPQQGEGLRVRGGDVQCFPPQVKSQHIFTPHPGPLPVEGRGRTRACGAASVLEKLTRAFGRENLFIEIQRHHLRGEERLNDALIDLARSQRLPLLATNGVLYAERAGRQVLDVFTCLRHHTHLDAAGTLLARNAERHLKSPSEMRALFHDLPEAVDNTLRLAERLEFSLEDLGYEFPKYPVPDGQSMDSFLRERAFAGARKRYGQIPAKVQKQLEDELKLITKLGVAGYFLIVWDIAEFCRAQNIMSQGRGSAANSTVCFCLGITAVDPLKFNTLFERFLSEGRRNHWPDIDIDLPSGDRRERVIQEVYKRYGKNGAAMTANVITYRGRSAAREIGKVLNIGTDVLDRFSALFANGDFPHTMDLSAQMQQSGLPTEHPRAAAFVTLYNQIKGLPRHLGQHSGGMIICEGKLDSVMPLENASMPGRIVAQWDKDDCERMGIIKVDLLGLGMMSVLQDAVELTRQRGHPVDLAKIPQDDPGTFKMMCEADTVGVFQIESRAQMATLPRMKPKCFYDVCIEVAIIRPGPIQGNLTHPFLKRRAGKENVTYYDKSLEPILKPILERTLGVPLFQEQMLEMAMRLADFSGSEAEELRRALSFHRSDKEMEKVSAKLRAALESKGHKPHVVHGVLNAITSFALYGFPESHAISFAHMAYSSAYLKAHYAPEFYASLLNNQPMGFYSSATLIKDGQRHGVHFQPVCVMQSEWDCTIESHADSTTGIIRLGLRVVRGLNENKARLLLAERSRAAFTSLDEFKRRVPLNKDELRVLAEIGALNCFASHRREAMWEVEKIQLTDDLFAALEGRAGCPQPDAPGHVSPLPPMHPRERLQADFAGMHLTVGQHPMSFVRPELKDVWRAGDLPKAKHGDWIRIAGNVICRQRPGTANGFVFISLEDETGISNAIVRPDLFEALRL